MLGKGDKKGKKGQSKFCLGKKKGSASEQLVLLFTVQLYSKLVLVIWC